jgi:hypothetical protein
MGKEIEFTKYPSIKKFFKETQSEYIVTRYKVEEKGKEFHYRYHLYRIKGGKNGVVSGEKPIKSSEPIKYPYTNDDDIWALFLKKVEVCGYEFYGGASGSKVISPAGSYGRAYAYFRERDEKSGVEKYYSAVYKVALGELGLKADKSWNVGTVGKGVSFIGDKKFICDTKPSEIMSNYTNISYYVGGGFSVFIFDFDYSRAS